MHRSGAPFKFRGWHAASQGPAVASVHGNKYVHNQRSNLILRQMSGLYASHFKNNDKMNVFSWPFWCWIQLSLRNHTVTVSIIFQHWDGTAGGIPSLYILLYGIYNSMIADTLGTYGSGHQQICY